MMKYFIIEAENSNPLPEIINWYNKINPKYINEESVSKIEEWKSLEVKVGNESVLPDVFSIPFFLLSMDASHIVRLYEPYIHMIGVRLISTPDRINIPYYMPILPAVECLSERSELTRGGLDIIRAVVEESRIGKRKLFQLGGISKRRVIIRLDLLESLLRRKAVSLKIEEVEVI